MAETTWTVVQFENDGTVEAVPSNWIEGNFCYWPTFSPNRLNAAIKMCEPHKNSWQLYHISIFSNATFDDYALARFKAKLAEGTSDLQSDLDNTKKRKRFSKTFSSSEEPLEELSLPTPPKMKNNTEASGETVAADRAARQEANVSASESILQIHEQIYPGPNSNEITKQLKTIITQNSLLKAMITDVMERVKKIEEKLSCSNSVADVGESFFTKFAYMGFPIGKISTMEKLEAILAEENNFQDGVKELATYGGAHTYDFVKRCLTAIMTNDVALQYSWYGRKGKMPFHKLNTAKLLIYAAEKAKITENRKATEIAIQMWLKRATDRRASMQKRY